MENDDLDPVTQEYDLFLSKDISDLYLLQFPLRHEELPEEGIKARFKSQAEILELLVPIDTQSDFYSMEKDLDFLVGNSKSDAIWTQHQPGFQHLSSTKVNLLSNYFAALFKEGKFFLVPIHSSLQLRPSLKHLTDQDQKIKLEEPVDPIEKSRALQVQFRKKESESQVIARLKSYSYLQRLANEESWTAFEYSSPNSLEAQDLGNLVSLAGLNPTVPFSTKDVDTIEHKLLGH